MKARDLRYAREETPTHARSTTCAGWERRRTSDAEGKSSSDDSNDNIEDENKKKDWAALRTEQWIANEKARKARKRRKIKEKAKELHKQHVANENKKDPTWDPEMELDVLQAGFKKLILIEKKK